MNQKQFLLTLLVAVMSGFLGGALSVWFLMPQSVLAQDEPQKVIEAEEFRVVDEDGKTLWEVSSRPDGHASMTLLNKDQSAGISFGWGNAHAPQITFYGKDLKERLVIGLAPSVSGGLLSGLSLFDTAGRRRALFQLSADERPMLQLSNLEGVASMILEIENVYDYSDLERTDDDRVVGERPHLILYDQEKQYGWISLTPDDFEVYLLEEGSSSRVKISPSSIEVWDGLDTRAVLGTTQLKHPDTGSTEIRAPSSLVLFDEEGNVVWSAP